jgi:uncharacterized protein
VPICALHHGRGAVGEQLIHSAYQAGITYNPRVTSLVSATILLVAFLQSPAAPPRPARDVIVQARTVVAAIVANEFGKVEEQFTDQMKSALPSGRLAGMWSALLNRAGAHKSCGTDARLVEIADKQMVITPCEFERAKVDIQFAFDRAGRISGLTFRPAPAETVPYTLPSYANPSLYSEEETSIGSAGWALPATLTLPAGSGRFAAVVLVHGSGPADRDETVGANKPFKDLAAGLGSRGVAVLRYDKRTNVHAARVVTLPDFTVTHEVIEDALEAVKHLRAHPRIDGARVFVLGHSLGGMLIPRIGAGDPTIAGWILLAAPARSLEDAIVEQARHLAMADGTISSEEQQYVDRAMSLAETVRALKPDDARSGRTISGAPASYWLDLRGYDPPSAAGALKGPMLILQGERDFQVTAKEFLRWKASLGSRPDVTFRSYPALNHLFIAGTGPGGPAEYQVPGHVAEDVIRDIASWIRIAREASAR